MVDQFKGIKRTGYCGELRRKDVGREVTLLGWVDSRRDFGSLIFVDIRDRSGMTQVVFNPEINKEAHQKARQLRDEYVIGVVGKVAARREGAVTTRLKTGEIEVLSSKLFIFNPSKITPFQLSQVEDASEDKRLKYRYLELRLPRLQRNFRLRHKLTLDSRNFLTQQGFIEVETPFLTKSTPEGARDYLVPSRLYPGFFYALPQSPQLFKQILMIAGFDRYFQIVKCFRDEDLRRDRQPEFTQIDIEMSFIQPDDLFKVIEGLMKEVFAPVGKSVKLPFPRIPYKKAMERFGTDKPDLRFSLELHDLTDSLTGSSFAPFADATSTGGCIKAIVVPKGVDRYTRKDIDGLNRLMQEWGAPGLVTLRFMPGEIRSPLIKQLGKEKCQQIGKKLGAEEGDLVIIAAGAYKVVTEALGGLRCHIAQEQKMFDPEESAFAWIVDFPLLEWNEREGRYYSCHHPFTSPREEDIPHLKSDPLKVVAKAYDLVLNGSEIGGGSIRIHSIELQREIFKILGLAKEEVERRFGFFLQALEYGAPPHGGIALGLDRIAMILAGESSIREVIAFPKTTSAQCILTDSPSPVPEEQLKELFIKVRKPENS